MPSSRCPRVSSVPTRASPPPSSSSPRVRTTERIWFYDMEHDGFSLDDKRQKRAENDIPDVLACWNNRKDSDFIAKRSARLTELKKSICAAQSRPP